MNVWSHKKILEKINYMHNNPVRRGLVSEPGDWPWSSWRFYYRDDSSILRMDPVPRVCMVESAVECRRDIRDLHPRFRQL